MDLVCIFPITANESKLPDILKLFEAKIAPRLYVMGANIEIKFPAPDYVYVPALGSLKGTTKGKGILDVLKNTPIPPDYAIMCDGSGKIPCKKVVDVFAGLIADSSINCVMAERVGTNKAISSLRFLIERWEVFILKHYFKYKKAYLMGNAVYGAIMPRQ